LLNKISPLSLHDALPIYKWGWLSVKIMDYAASLLKLQPIEVYEVATFYTMFHMKPVGKYVFEFCHTGPCCLVGAEKIQKYIENRSEEHTSELQSPYDLVC